MMSLDERHGTTRRVPDRDDTMAWGSIAVWLGASDGWRVADGAVGIEVDTPSGTVLARVGDWIIRTLDKQLHVAHPSHEG